MILRRLKLFSSLKEGENNILNKAETATQELVKLLVFSKRDLIDIPHWSEELATYIKDIEKTSFSGSYLFLPIISNYKDLPKVRFNAGLVLRARKNRPLDEYIQKQYDFLYTQKDYRGLKYKELIDTLKRNKEIPEDDIFIQQAKYLLLRLNGQIDENTEWYDSIVQTTQVDWNKKLGEHREKDIEKIVRKILGLDLN